MKTDEYKSLVKEIGQLIDARAKTTEMVLKAEIRSEIRGVENRLQGEIAGVEGRLDKRLTEMKEELQAEILLSRAEAKADILNLEAKVIKKLHDHEDRIENLEENTNTPNPHKH